MSTRAIIARQTGEGWEGVYHHSDGYPTWLGRNLHALCREHFGGDAMAMSRFIIDEHPAGWSHLPDTPGESGCYCHDGNNSEGPLLYTHRDAAEAFDIEWTYILTPEALLVFDGCSEMIAAGRVEWSADPDKTEWGRIECGEDLERCKHYAWVHFPEMKGISLGTAKYLGREPLEPRDAVGYIYKGERVECTGSGHAEGFMYLMPSETAAVRRARKNGERVNGTRWFESVRRPDGEHIEIPAFYQRGAKAGQWCPGVEPIWPPTREALPKDSAN